jgi:hypothetical protein
MTNQPKTFPPEVAKAVVAVMSQVKKLAKDGRNEHGRYNFTSVDAFYTAVGPLCADAGLFLIANEVEREVIPSPVQGKAGSLRILYDLTLVHESGESFSGIEREVTVTAAGPQSYAAALSFVTKYFWRNLMQIPTGDADDADLQEATPLPGGKSGQKAKANKENADAAAKKFAQEAIDLCAKAERPQDIEAFQSDKAKHLDKLKDGFPTLYDEVKLVMDAKMMAFASADDQEREAIQSE